MINFIEQKAQMYFILSAAVLLLLWLFDFCLLWQLIALSVVVYFVLAFRQSERFVSNNSEEILSPVDGKVMFIDKDLDKQKLVIASSICNEGSVRLPIQSELVETKHQRGLHLLPIKRLAQKLNEKISYQLKSDDLEYEINLLAGRCAFKLIDCSKENMEKGAKLAHIADGLVEIVIPADVDLQVDIGDDVKSSRTLLWNRG